MEAIYLDNHTATRPCEAAIEAMRPYLQEQWGLPTAPHAMGQELLASVDAFYGEIYGLLGARNADSFVLTSSGAEGVNQVVMGAYLKQAQELGRNHFLTTNVDEAPVVLGFERVEQFGCETGMVPIDSNGVISEERLGDALTPRTSLVSLSWANGLTGVIQPVEQIADLCRERGVWCHLEASHVLGKIAFDLDEIAPDLMTFHGGLLHAPQGVGGLWIRSGLRLPSLIVGGQDQDGMRAGSLSVAHLAALAAAAREAREMLDHVTTETARLRDRFELAICEGVEDVRVLFQECERLPTTSCILFPGVTSDALLYHFNRAGVYASFGGGQYQLLSLQLEASGLKRPEVECAVSFSLSRDTTEREVEAAVTRIVESATKLRAISGRLYA